jgi:hypothetical protein
MDSSCARQIGLGLIERKGDRRFRPEGRALGRQARKFLGHESLPQDAVSRSRVVDSVGSRSNPSRANAASA